MKLSDIKGDAAIDLIADLLPYIINIASDKEAAELFKRGTVPEGMTVREYAVKRLSSGIPALMKNHKHDLVAIMAAINQTTPEDYASNMTVFTLIRDLGDLVSDPVFAGFFESAKSDQNASMSTPMTSAAAM